MTDVDDENNSQLPAADGNVEPQPADPTDGGFENYSIPDVQPSVGQEQEAPTEVILKESQYDRWVHMNLLNDMGRDVGEGEVALPDA